MTIRLAVAVALEDEDYVAALMVGIDLLRAANGRPTSFEGCCSSCLKWVEFYGKPNALSLARWINDLGPIADYELPDDLVFKVIDSA